MTSGDLDARVRAAAFQFIRDQLRLHSNGVIPRDVLLRGFPFEGRTVALVSRQGIFKPAVLPDVALSITTVPAKFGVPRPYEDELTDDRLLIYRYRGEDPNHYQNVSLRRAWERQVPVIYFAGVATSRYMPFHATIVDDDPGGLCFLLEVAEMDVALTATGTTPGVVAETQRAYATTMALRRLHQQTFRRHVLRAYYERCAICRLRHVELLDAAHILPDTHPNGEPIVPNGLSLCRLHHAAFDGNIIGVRPDLRVDVRQDVREEIDGPMLRHGLQDFHGSLLHVPRAQQLKPNRLFLEERYELFRSAL